MPVQFRVLGDVEAVVADKAVPLGHARQRCVLAALLVEPNRSVSVDQLIERVWSQRPPQRAREALHSYLSRLRQVLNGADDARLVRRPGGYALTVDELAVDLHRFDHLAARARAGTDPTESAALFEEALALWRGVPFAGLESSWLDGIRGAIERRRFAVELDRNDISLAIGRHADVLDAITAAAEDQPFDERIAGQLMLALYRSGRQADAIDVFHRVRRRLSNELGTDPGPALGVLYQRILTADRTIIGSGPTIEPAPPPAGVPTGQRLAGRDAELADLRTALTEAYAGHGRVVLLTGEQGVGKTRLAQAFAEEARAREAQVLWGTAWEEGAPSFWPWIQVVRQWSDGRGHRPPETADADLAVISQIVPTLPVPATAPSAEPATARFRLFDAVTHWLGRVSTDRPTVVVLDDVHRADTPSLLLLRFLAGQLHGVRLLLLVIHRDAGTGPSGLAKPLAELGQVPSTRRIRLGGLSVETVGRLLEQARGRPASAELVRAVHERTGGNPFFVGELINLLRDRGRLDKDDEDDGAAVDDVPRGVTDVVRGRIEELSGDARHLLAAASVIGTEFPISILGPVADVAGERLIELLDEAEAAGLVSGSAGAERLYRFPHALIRDAVYGQLSGAVRARLHGRAGDVLESLYGAGPGPHLAVLAHHFLCGAPEVAAERGTDYATRAGHYAMRVTAWEDASVAFEAALRQPVGPLRRCELLIALGDAQMRSGDAEQGRQTYRRAVDAADGLPDRRLFGRAVLGFSTTVEFLRGEHTLVGEITELLERALATLAPGDVALRVRLLSRLALALYLAPPELQPAALRRRDQLSAEAVEQARALGDEALVAQALYARCFATWRPDTLVDRIALSDELVRLAERVGAEELILHGRHWQVVNALETGDVDAADRGLGIYARHATKLGQPLYRYWTAVLSATRAAMRGQFDVAEGLAMEAHEISERLGSQYTGFSNGVAAQLQALRWAQGRMSELEPMVAVYVEQRPDMPAWRMCLAQIYADQGRLADARTHFDILARDDFAGIPRDPYWLPAVTGLAEVCAILGDTARSRLLYDLLRPFQGRLVIVSVGFACIGAVDYSLGRLATVLRDWTAAQEHFESARRIQDRAGALPPRARTAQGYAAMLAARDGPGDRARADTLLAEAAQAAADLGVPVPEHHG